MSKMNYFIEKNKKKKCNNLCGVLWALKFNLKRLSCSKIPVNKSYRSVDNIEFIVNLKLRRYNQSEFDTKDPTTKD